MGGMIALELACRSAAAATATPTAATTSPNTSVLTKKLIRLSSVTLINTHAGGMRGLTPIGGWLLQVILLYVSTYRLSIHYCMTDTSLFH
jgi:hypothetical protein